MALDCRINRNKDNSISYISAPNGERSILFDGLRLIFGEEKALNLYALTETENFQNILDYKRAKFVAKQKENIDNPLQQAIRRNNGNPLNLAPNGKPSILYQSYKDLGYTDQEAEMLTAQTFTDEFRDWFEGSKVVDENGQALMLFHGTPKFGFNEFEIKEGSKYKSNMQLLFGSHFASSYKDAEIYAGKKGGVYYSFLNLRNPLNLVNIEYINTDKNFNNVLGLIRDLRIDKTNKNSIDYTLFTENGDYGGISKDIQRLYIPQFTLDNISPKKVKEALEKNNFDGVFYTPYKLTGQKSYEKYSNSFIALTPNQIKSATENLGSFSNKTDDIRFSIIGEQGAQNSPIKKYNELLQTAKQLEAQGVSPQEISNQTGWYKQNNQWKYLAPELLKDFQITNYEVNKIKKLKDVLQGNLLLEMYPTLGQIEVVFYDNSKENAPQESKNWTKVFAAYNPKTRVLGVNTNINGNTPSINEISIKFAHEAAHIIQRIEGFPLGGNRNSVLFEAQKLLNIDNNISLRDKYNAIRNADKTKFNKEEQFILQKSLDTINAIASNDAVTLSRQYKYLMGEIDANLVEDVMDKVQNGEDITLPYNQFLQLFAEDKNIDLDNVFILRNGDVTFSMPNFPLRGTSAKKAEKEVIDRLKQTGLANTVTEINSQEIEEKLKELGVDEQTRKQVTAYHASPNKFEKFSRQFLGKGVGAMRSGAGIYFAIDKQKAESYANKFAREYVKIGSTEYNKVSRAFEDSRTSDTINKIFEETGGERIPFVKKLLEQSNNEIERFKEAKDEFLKTQKKYTQQQIEEGDYEIPFWLDDIRDIARKYRRIAKEVLENGVQAGKDISYLYKVTIFDNGNWIDFTKNITDEQYDAILEQAKKENSPYLEAIEQSRGKKGRNFYWDVANSVNQSERRLSDLLMRAGIDGNIGLEDANMREYVVFDENAITIEEQIQFSKNLAEKGIKPTVNGFVTAQGDIYINSDLVTNSVYLHEYQHLLNSWYKQSRPEAYQRGLNLIQQELGDSDTEALSKRLLSKYPNLKTLFLSESKGVLSIDMIEVDKNERSKGVGSKVISEILDYADKKGILIELVPSVKDSNIGTTSRTRLVDFYKRFNFVENKGRNKDFERRSGGMYRTSNKVVSEIQDIIDFVKSAQPNLEGEALLEEILTETIGRKSNELIESKRTDSPIMQWLSELWEELKSVLGLRNMTPEQVANLTLGEYIQAVQSDLLSGESFTNEAQEYFTREADRLPLTLAVFERPEFKKLQGKEVNPITVLNALNQTGIKQIEKDLIKDIIEKNFSGQNIISEGSKIGTDSLLKQIIQSPESSDLYKIAELLLNNKNIKGRQVILKDYDSVSPTHGQAVGFIENSKLSTNVAVTDFSFLSEKTTNEFDKEFFKNQSFQETLLHEELHRYTSYILQVYNHFREQVDTQEEAFSEFDKYFNSVLDSPNLEKEKEFIKEYEILFEIYQKNGGTFNNREFITYGLTNESEINKIKKIKVGKETLLKRLIDSLFNLFTEPSLYNALYDTFSNYYNNFDQTKYNNNTETIKLKLTELKTNSYTQKTKVDKISYDELEATVRANIMPLEYKILQDVLNLPNFMDILEDFKIMEKIC